MNEEQNKLNEAVLKKLRASNLIGRLLTSVALGVGIFCIAIGILLMWANSTFIFPQVQSLVKEYQSAPSSDSNSFKKAHTDDPDLVLSDGKAVDRQILVTLGMGKAMYIMSRAMALLGVGTLLTLLLVIFNRRVTLSQINYSLAQISGQIKELQSRQGPGKG